MLKPLLPGSLLLRPKHPAVHNQWNRRLGGEWPEKQSPQGLFWLELKDNVWNSTSKFLRSTVKGRKRGKKIPICMNFEWQANRDATKGRLGGAKECLGNSSFPPCPITCIILAPVLLATLDKLRDEENDSSQYQLNLAQPDTQRSSVTSNSRCLASTCGIGFVPACPMPYLNFEEYPFTFWPGILQIAHWKREEREGVIITEGKYASARCPPTASTRAQQIL